MQRLPAWRAARVLLPALLILPAAGCTAPDQRLQQRLAGILEAQADAWNRGDIDAFMQHYWNSDELTFSSGGQTRHGWQATLERYRQRYPTPERMGRLAFSELTVRPLGERAALVLGRYHLERQPDPADGNFSLVFERIAGRWVITHDHTSAAEGGLRPPPESPAEPHAKGCVARPGG